MNREGSVLIGACVALVTAVAAFGQTVAPSWPPCLPSGGNAVVEARLQPETGWASVRTYFRKLGTSDFYFLEMRAAGNGLYWCVLPKPEANTKAVELYLAAKNDQGKEVRSDTTKVDVTIPCQVTLNPEQASLARSLVVGETSPSQQGREVVGFMCDGIISRLTAAGKIVADEFCRKAGAEKAAAEKQRKVLVPLLVAGGVGGAVLLREEEKKEASPSRP